MYKLKSIAKSGRTDVEIKNYKTLLKEHQKKSSAGNLQSYASPPKSSSIAGTVHLRLDGMDQKNTSLPHFRRLPKDIGDECLVRMHLLGCLSFCQTIRPQVFITYPNIHNDPNLIITVMYSPAGTIRAT